MLFNSPEFFIFFTVVTALYFVMPLRLRNVFLLLAGYVFYMAWRPIYIFIIVGSTLTDYLCSLALMRTEDPRRRKLLLATSVTVNLSVLFFFKYSYFVAENLAELARVFGYPVDLPYWRFVLPLGISFYIFQTMCYTIDVFRRKVPAEKNPIDFFLYVSFFPTLIAGPIERAGELMPQLKTPRVFDFERIGRGLVLVFWGLFMKMALADTLAPFVDRTYGNLTAENHGLPFVLAAYGYMLQLFFDFAGYSAIALGTAKILGFELMGNFNAPFLARNIADFWHRWHISLSTWFRDYVFMPFYLHLEKSRWFRGFSMENRHRLLFFVAILLADLMLGFWHGADWGFGLFGIYHAVMVTLFYLFRRSWKKMPDVLQLFLTFQIVVVSGIFFRLRNLEDIGYVFRHLLTGAPLEFGVILASGVILWGADRLYNWALPQAQAWGRSRTAYILATLVWAYAVAFFLWNRDWVLSHPVKEFLYFQF